MKQISIVGCGWLGLPLGKYLSENGFEVKGSTTQISKLEVLKANHIEPFLLKLSPQLEAEQMDVFLNTDTLLINIPPKISLQKQDAHVEQMTNLLEKMNDSSIKNIIYVSSTSVYPELNREVFEEDVKTPSESASPTLVKAENLLWAFAKEKNKQLTILRCGGLMGYERIPAKYFAGWKGLTSGNTPVNYIHRDDLIRIIETIINQNLWNETFNIVSPIHPIRKEIYTKNCQELGFEMPEFVEPSEPSPFKIVNADKFIKSSNYHFLYQNPLDFLYQR
jgi:nucleoside-diphosphate-sugar epimerase